MLRPAMGKFMYFAYGSNLLALRIHVKNPSAVRRGIGKLQDYRLDFGTPDGYISTNWGGAPATIVPETGSHVWGAIWELDDCDLASLDAQETVSEGFYKRISIEVEADGQKCPCLSYCFVKTPEKLESEDCRAGDRLPSYVYMHVIVNGAEESGLPSKYVDYLKSFQNNGFKGGPHCPVKLN